nr:amidohydrolase family protein [Pyxidicoccus fallax]
MSLLFKNARIVDGTGNPAFTGDVGVAGDRIAYVGMGLKADAKAERIIDASGKVLAPGFIELHTHYDPQLCWDRTASPAAEHGVTTVVMGNCSLSLAPVTGEGRAKMTRMFNRIEDLRPELFAAAVPYCWEDFRQYLDFVRPGLGINAGAVVGHSTLRHYVMGEAAQQRPATDAELERMCAVLGDALAAGAFGLSLSYDHLHDENDHPVASSFADTRERVALARVISAHQRAYVQCNINLLDTETRLRQLDELGTLALESGVFCSVLGIMENPVTPGQWVAELEKVDALKLRGARMALETQVRPLDLAFSLNRSWLVAYYMPTWAAIMARSPSERAEGFADRALRQRLDEETRPFENLFRCIHVRKTGSRDNQAYVGRSLWDISRAEGGTMTDALLDISLREGLATVFDWRNAIHANVNIVGHMLNHPSVKVGGSDAGAHIAQFSGEGDSTFMLECYVREHGKLTLERAIHRMTGEMARDFNIRDRGIITEGRFADLVLFDPATVARGEEHLVDDVPGGGGRYVRRATGFESVVVNGRVFVERGRYTDARAGRIV